MYLYLDADMYVLGDPEVTANIYTANDVTFPIQILTVQI